MLGNVGVMLAEVSKGFFIWTLFFLLEMPSGLSLRLGTGVAVGVSSSFFFAPLLAEVVKRTVFHEA